MTTMTRSEESRWLPEETMKGILKHSKAVTYLHTTDSRFTQLFELVLVLLITSVKIKNKNKKFCDVSSVPRSKSDEYNQSAKWLKDLHRWSLKPVSSKNRDQLYYKNHRAVHCGSCCRPTNIKKLSQIRNQKKASFFFPPCVCRLCCPCSLQNGSAESKGFYFIFVVVVYFLCSFISFPSLSDVKGNCGVVCVTVFRAFFAFFFFFCVIKELNGEMLRLRRASFLTSVVDSRHILQNVQKINVY